MDQVQQEQHARTLPARQTVRIRRLAATAASFAVTSATQRGLTVGMMVVLLMWGLTVAGTAKVQRTTAAIRQRGRGAHRRLGSSLLVPMTVMVVVVVMLMTVAGGGRRISRL